MVGPVTKARATRLVRSENFGPLTIHSCTLLTSNATVFRQSSSVCVADEDGTGHPTVNMKCKSCGGAKPSTAMSSGIEAKQGDSKPYRGSLINFTPFVWH